MRYMSATIDSTSARGRVSDIVHGRPYIIRSGRAHDTSAMESAIPGFHNALHYP
jgi:hypothetical protein